MSIGLFVTTVVFSCVMITVGIILVCVIEKAYKQKKKLVGGVDIVDSPVIISVFVILLGICPLDSCFIVMPKDSFLWHGNNAVIVSTAFRILPSYKLPHKKSVWSGDRVIKFHRQSVKVQTGAIADSQTNLRISATIEYGGDAETMIATIRWDGVELTRARSTVERTIVEFYQERDFEGTESERDDLHALIESKFPEKLNIRCTFLEVRRQN